MDFNGQKCPACGRSFDQDDDIVVCPVCGTPQHRSCWDERGECANAARHAEGYVWQPETPEYSAEPHTEEQTQDRQNTQICPVCGSENEPNSLSCTNCGAPLTAGGAQPFNPFFKAGEAGNPFLYGVTLDPEREIYPEIQGHGREEKENILQLGGVFLQPLLAVLPQALAGGTHIYGFDARRSPAVYFKGRGVHNRLSGLFGGDIPRLRRMLRRHSKK